MAAIIDVSGDRRLQLGNEEFVRAFNFGTRWQKIQVGFQVGVNAIQGFTARLCVGFCDGPYGITAPVSAGVIGACPGSVSAGGASWTTTTGGFANGGGTRQPFTKTGSTITGGSNVGNGTTVLVSTSLVTAKTMSMWLFSAERSLTNWNAITFKTAFTQAAQVGQIIEPFNFYKNLENDAGSGFYGVPNADSGSPHVYSGFLDNVLIAWDKSCPTLEITKIGVVRLA